MPYVTIQNYLSVSVPSINQAEEITDRPHGDLVIYKVFTENGIEIQAEEICRALIDNIEIYEGSRNQSIVLSGYKTVVKTPQNIILDNVIYRKFSGVSIASVRTAVPDTYLNPGDTVTDGENVFVADSVTYFVGTSYCQMDVQA